ncbi:MULTISPECIES: MFS transporter [Chromobacterium]|uniref:MFS transporter n=1 Tax=Chromobacterium rhizoryzae TaxID=1778675 RepID=A0AAD0W6G1_9NEIS|nr:MULTISPECIES: MFS transporter [Chromobacterium]AXT45280.1 MFS transporter [Chromobacterium rhizoryzae]PTU71597.1 MFS transporter [Chromobacterium haemolyticum]QOD83548.1 MFS transporter [Chromobacterium haemolyticum]
MSRPPPAPWLKRLLSPYRGLPATVYIQVLCSLINNIGGISKLFLPLYLRENYQLGYAQIGLMMAAYGAGALLGSLNGGALSDRFDGRKLATLFLTASGLCLLLLALAIPLWLFVPVLLVSGFADGAFRPVNLRLALEPCLPRQRAVAQGMLRVAFNLGVAGAGLLSGSLAAIGYDWVYAANAAATLSAALWLAWAYRRNDSAPVPPAALETAETGAEALVGPSRDLPFLRMLLALTLMTAVFDQIYVTLGLFLREHYQLGPQWMGYLFTLNGLMVVALQIPISRRILDWGLLASTQAGVLLTGVSFLWLTLGQGPLWALLMMTTLTLGELLVSPCYTMLVMHRSEGRLRGRYLGLYNAVWQGRTLFAPALGTWLYGAVGGVALWWMCAAAVCLSALIQQPALRLMLARQSEPAPQSRFKAAPAKASQGENG